MNILTDFRSRKHRYIVFIPDTQIIRNLIPHNPFDRVTPCFILNSTNRNTGNRSGSQRGLLCNQISHFKRFRFVQLLDFTIPVLVLKLRFERQPVVKFYIQLSLYSGIEYTLFIFLKIKLIQQHIVIMHHVPFIQLLTCPRNGLIAIKHMHLRSRVPVSIFQSLVRNHTHRIGKILVLFVHI